MVDLEKLVLITKVTLLEILSKKSQEEIWVVGWRNKIIVQEIKKEGAMTDLMLYRSMTIEAITDIEMVIVETVGHEIEMQTSGMIILNNRRKMTLHLKEILIEVLSKTREMIMKTSSRLAHLIRDVKLSTHMVVL